MAVHVADLGDWSGGALRRRATLSSPPSDGLLRAPGRARRVRRHAGARACEAGTRSRSSGPCRPRRRRWRVGAGSRTELRWYPPHVPVWRVRVRKAGPRLDWFVGGVRAAARENLDRRRPRRSAPGSAPALARHLAHEAAQRGPRHRRDPGAARRPPVVMLADHPTTGGYPVIGVVGRRRWPGVAHLTRPPGLQPIRDHVDWRLPRAPREGHL